MNEYDTKFVHPTVNHPVRDVGTQTRETATAAGTQTREVDIYKPMTIINRGFKVNPNPSYASHLSDDSMGPVDSPSYGRIARSTTTPNLMTPSNGYSQHKSPYRDTPSFTPSRPPLNRASPSRGDGGSLGVFSHANSPLKKAASSSQLRHGSRYDSFTATGRTGSPLKRMSTPGDTGHSRDRASLGQEALHNRLSSFK